MFWILHILAILFFWPALFVTIPFHILTGTVQKKGGK